MISMPRALSIAAQVLLIGSCVARKYVDADTVIYNSKRWLSLPPTPGLPSTKGGKYANVNNIKLWYDQFGSDSSKHSPIFFLHGGLANSNYYGHQVDFFNGKGFKLVTVDSRGHGRSTTDFNVPISYDLMCDDFIALMDQLKMPKASFVGWSDGAINALNIASKHPSRVDKVFAFAANYIVSGVMDISTSTVFTTYINRTAAEYSRLNPNADRYNDFLNQIQNMWATQPNWTESFFKPINASNVWIVDADHEEAIYRNQPDQMAKWLPDGGELILPQVSHFAFIQSPDMFNAALWNLFAQV